MASTVNISEVKCLLDERYFEFRFHKARKTENSETKVFDENSIEQHCTSQYVSGQNIYVAIKKNAGMARVSTSNKVESEVPENVFPTRRVMYGTQGINAEENDRINGVSCKCSSESVSEESSPDVEFKKKAQVILKSIRSSYQYQVASETIAHAIGSPLSEFEKSYLFCLSCY
jgi:hypothetical protein